MQRWRHFGTGLLRTKHLSSEDWLRNVYETGARSELVKIAERYYGDANYNEAARWFRRAAEKGSAKARYRLALMYADGIGVPRSPQAAYRMMRTAAWQGHKRAREWLEARKRQDSS